MTITELKTLLASISGPSFSLTATQLGVDSVDELFQTYLPESTLTISNPQPAVNTLQVTGQMTLGNADNVPTVVTFLPDATNTFVAGINITLSLTSWIFTAPFADFSGTALAAFGFTAPQVVLSAGDINLANGSAATFMGGMLAVTGTGETINATLLGQIPYDTPAAREGILTYYVFEVELVGITLASLNALTQFISGADFDIIPSTIPCASSFGLTHIEFVVDPEDDQLISMRFTVESLEGLTVVKNVFEIKSFEFSFQILLPDVSTKVNGVVTTTMDIYGELIDLALSLPDLHLVGALGHDDPVPLKPFVSNFIPASIVPDDFMLSALHFGINLEAPNDYSFDITLTNIWSIAIGSQNFDMTSLTVAMDGAGATSPGLSIHGQITFGGAELYLSAEQKQGSNSWLFKGGTVGSSSIAFPDFEPTPLQIGNLLADLGSSFGIDLPGPVKTLELGDIQTSFDTGTNAFTFFVSGDFTVDDTPILMTVSVDISPHGGPGQYEAKFGGKIQIGSLLFDLVFDEKNLQSETFIASYSHTDGDPDSISLRDLVATVSSQLAQLVPGGIEIQLKDVKFVFYRKADASKQFAFGLDLAISIDLSDVPVVGDKLPEGVSLQLKDLQGIYSSDLFTASQVGEINLLLDPSVTPFPSAGMSQGFNFTADLQLGSESAHFSLGVPQEQTTDQASAVTQSGDTQTTGTGDAAVSTAPPLTTQWIDVHQQFGIFQFDRIGAGYQNNILSFALDASVSLESLTFSMDGLSVGSPLDKFEPVFDLNGLGLDYKNPPLEIGGAFLKTLEQSGGKTLTSYYGEVIVKTASFSLTALGGWAPEAEPASFFLYANVEAPIGGPPFLYITGLAGGIGINRSLKLPTVDQISGYLLLPANAPKATDSPGSTISTVLPQVQSIFIEDPGEYWIAAGIEFTSFEMIKAFVLLTVAFGVDLQIDMLGTGAMTFPKDEPYPVAYIDVDLIASFTPSTGLLAIDGKLSPASYIYGGFCKLSGGFAFYAWFSGANAGNFVVTAGGYHPAFTKPNYYPTVPRLEQNFVLGPFKVTGDAYFALTPSMMMAGLRMSAVWDSGPVRAWLDAGVDFLISWAPFHYKADVFINVGCSVDMGLFTVNAHIGADLYVWGPPFGGRCHVDLDVVSFTISFGADASTPPPVGWSTFKNKFLPQDSTVQRQPGPMLAALTAETPESGTNILKASVPAGLLQSDVDGFNWILDPEHFAIVTSSTIPANNGEWALSSQKVVNLPNTVSSYNPSRVDVTGGPYLSLAATTATFSATVVWNPTVNIGPMDQANVQSYQTIQISKRTESDPRGTFSEFITAVSVAPQLLPSSTALWAKNNSNKTPNDPLLIPAALTGFLIAPIPRVPASVNDVPLIQLLFAEGFSTGFRYQTALVDPNYTVTSSVDSAEELTIGIKGKHTATLTNKDYILSALADPWITTQRASILDDLAANDFSTYKSTEIDLSVLATKTSLTDWPIVTMLGSN